MAHFQKVKAKSGKRPDLNNRYFRSVWEANWARYLNFLVKRNQIKTWSYESETFKFPVKRGNRFYTPDFSVVSNSGDITIHEVKGWMDNDSRVKLKRMKKFFSKVKILLVDGPTYQAVARALSGVIPHWE